MRRRGAAAALLLVVACGGSSGTVEVPREDLPFEVRREPTTVGAAEPARTVTVYFTRGTRLQAARRDTETVAPGAEAAVRALLTGPTTQERAAGVRTALPASVRFLDLHIEADLVRIDLSAEFQEPADPDRVALRVAQVVWTLTGQRGVTQVLFAIDGEPVAVATDDGETVERPVTRTDFARFSP